MKRVEFYYDLVSPCSYLAYGRVKRVYKDRAAGPDRDTEQGSLPAPDIHRWAGHYGLPMQFPEPFPFRTLKTMRATLAGVGDLEEFTRETFVLYWEEGGAPKSFEEVGEDEPIREVARRIGRDPEEVLESATTGEAKEALKSATGEAVERGVFGAPTFFGGDEMFWGNDRLHFVEVALQKG
jgi:2-hydroxychromene-2-carboxylate isomerase